MRIAFILSNHQFYVFKSVLAHKGMCYDDFDLIVLDTSVNLDIADFIVNAYQLSFDRNVSFFSKLQQLVRERRKLFGFLETSALHEVWYPNGGMHLINMVLKRFSRPNTKKILFEDGLGAYVDSGLYDWKFGFNNLFLKLGLYLLFFPSYTLKSAINDEEVDECWSIYGGVKIRACKQYKSIDMGLYRDAAVSGGNVPQALELRSMRGVKVLVVGQPLNHLQNDHKRLRDYVSAIQALHCETGGTLVYRPHPRESTKTTSALQAAFIRHGIPCRIMEPRVSLEWLVSNMPAEEGGVRVVSPLSTSLYVGKALRPDMEFYFYSHAGKRVLSQQVESFMLDKGIINLCEMMN